MRHRHHVLAVLAAVLTIGLLAGGCTSRRIACRNDACSVEVTGEQTIDDLGPGWDVRILGIGADGLTLAVDGAQATVPAGQRAEVGAVTVTVKQITGNEAAFEIRG